MQTVITPFPLTQAPACGPKPSGALPAKSHNSGGQDARAPRAAGPEAGAPPPAPGQGERDARPTPEDALTLDLAAARLELLAHEAEADARQFNTLREPSAAASCRLEADTLRLAVEYLRAERHGLPAWLEGVVTGGGFIAFRPSHGLARSVTSFRPACEVLLDYACQMGKQAEDAQRTDRVIAAGYRAESTALRFAAAVLVQEKPATAAQLAA